MNKEYVRIGMIVDWNGQEVLVNYKSDSTVFIRMPNGDIIEVSYDDIKTPTNIEARKYNSRISHVQSIRQGKYDKVSDAVRFDDSANVWFTSDTHFGHENILKFCERPFDSVEEMNATIIDNWNKLVQPDDTVFHLGDFAWGGSKEWNDILSQLHGHIHLILGNHDVKNLREGYMKYFESVSFQKQITVEGQSIYLNHYPFLTYGGVYRDQPVWQLFGHVHSRNGRSGKDTIRMHHILPTQYDVGVDNNNYRPVSFNQIKKIIQDQIDISNE